jgi:hypothetical protein
MLLSPQENLQRERIRGIAYAAHSMEEHARELERREQEVLQQKALQEKRLIREVC